MASIFTYEPEPPRVSSPWPATASSGRVTPALGHGVDDPRLTGNTLATPLLDPDIRLEAEPQEGPTEYKLHLLLRPRRSVSATSSRRRASGSQRSSRGSSAPRNDSPPATSSLTPSAVSNASRQHRLEQLTTQLLWRLQQSSPHHSTSINNLVLPSLPAATPELRTPEQPAKLLPGLEESNGALYEIGVSDDGTLVGISMGEMHESLTNLRAMAGSLGCVVDVLRLFAVGEGALVDDQDVDNIKPQSLYVAEAYVKPVLHTHDEGATTKSQASQLGNSKQQEQRPNATAEQLRVSLTGATTCGKSSLLGTLSTSTLDNGRGKSRLSLLKHRHEIATGVTSSVAQELVGYSAADAETDGSCSVLNYAHENVTTWSDIQVNPELCRSALLIDSAGHPRFRRTTVRGLVGWAPHWTFLCIAANEDLSAVASDKDVPGESPKFSGANAHISMAHLDLCLKLGLRLVIVITKFDEATRVAFRQLLSSLLTRLKDAGRKPIVLPNSVGSVSESSLHHVMVADRDDIQGLCAEINQESQPVAVPILFTSAVNGTGIAKLHALLACLPVRLSDNTGSFKQKHAANAVFNIDDSFNFPMSTPGHGQITSGCVISGYLDHAPVSVGDELSLGPSGLSSSSRQVGPTTSGTSLPHSGSQDVFLEPRSFTDALARTTTSPRLRAIDAAQEWRKIRVVSIRNLRLPVHTLRPDQVGTIGIVPADEEPHVSLPLQIRKGMVLTRGEPTASHTFTASFAAEEAASVVVGTIVVVYCKSVRAGARVVAIALDMKDEEQLSRTGASNGESEASEDLFDMDDSTAGSFNEGALFESDDMQSAPPHDPNQPEESTHAQSISVTLQFVAAKEYLELGAQVLVMPSGGPTSNVGGSIKDMIGGLDGYVGTVTRTFG